MCVIAVKPAGLDMPSDRLIKDMWDTNPDGAGFMFAAKGDTYVEKGFLEFEDFKEALEHRIKALRSKSIDVKDIPFILHFRIGTHGANTAENTHPFPVNSDVEMLKSTKVVTKLGVCHNGIIRSVTPVGGISDTMQYIKDILVPMYIIDNNFSENAQFRTIMENTIGWSKLAFLSGDGQISLVGDFEEVGGIMYSNLNHDAYAYYDNKYCSGASCHAPLVRDVVTADVLRLRPHSTKGFYLLSPDAYKDLFMTGTSYDKYKRSDEVGRYPINDDFDFDKFINEKHKKSCISLYYKDLGYPNAASWSFNKNLLPEGYTNDYMRTAAIIRTYGISEDADVVFMHKMTAANGGTLNDGFSDIKAEGRKSYMYEVLIHYDEKKRAFKVLNDYTYADLMTNEDYFNNSEDIKCELKESLGE